MGEVQLRRHVCAVVHSANQSTVLLIRPLYRAAFRGFPILW